MIMDNAISIELQRSKGDNESYRKGELEVTVRLIAAGKVVAAGGDRLGGLVVVIAGDRCWWWMGWW